MGMTATRDVVIGNGISFEENKRSFFINENIKLQLESHFQSLPDIGMGSNCGCCHLSNTRLLLFPQAQLALMSRPVLACHDSKHSNHFPFNNFIRAVFQTWEVVDRDTNSVFGHSVGPILPCDGGWLESTPDLYSHLYIPR